MKAKNLTKRVFTLLLALILALTPMLAAPVTAEAASDGINAGQPFPTSAVGSGHYRIPAFITTNNGTLIAAADARWHPWDSTDDNGDIDTIVSRSTNNGATWNYTFANYIDNGDTTNYKAATFIDPALAYDGTTVYMIVDLFPGQASQKNCTAAAKSGTGYNSNGELLLSTSATASSTSSFGYYLSNGRILSSSGKDQGYTVDAWFNVKDASGKSCGNLFDYDNTCGFHPLMTSHLYLTKSTDNGATWSAPVMLNHQVKGTSTTYYLVSPGRGIVTSDGTIIFGAYDNKNQASLIYSRDGGETWSRSGNFGSASSENEIVELSNGKLRMFYRYGYSSSGKVKYVDITKTSSGGYSWGSAVSTSASFNGNVNISAISYSKTTDGKQVILVSCPADTSGTYQRYNGKIYTFTTDGTSMTLVNTYDIDSSSAKDAFSYSCMTEQADGSIGILYEKGDSGNITYRNVAAETVTGLTFDAAAHTYEETVVDATCTENGQIIYTCTDCGDSYTEEIPALGHNYESAVTDATCDQAGSTTYTCANCGDSYAEEIPALGHNYKSVVTDATCDKAGFTTYTCGTCGDSYTADKVAALGHNYESVVTAPTCDKAGSTTYTCTACGDSYAEEIPALGHSYESEVTAPTCDKAGFTTYTCAACGDSYTADKVAALGHDYESETVEADCTTDGGTVYTCAVCGDSYIADKVAAYGHDYITTTVDATCETAGSVTTTCAACGDKTVETIPALGHSYETVTVDATCETAGSVSKVCTVCGDAEVETIPALGHDYKTTTVDATCEAAGSVTTACAACGDKTVETIPALGHDYKTTTVEVTCETDGSVTTACANCGDKTVETIPALGHDITTTTVDATCETAGSVTTTCGNCGETTQKTIPALGHDYETVTVEATCETAGSITKTCAVCGEVTVETIPALGHAYKTTTVDATCEAAGSVTSTCSNCGDKTVETIPALGHAYKTTTVAATCENDGSVTTACANCGDKTVETIPALGHDYSSVTVSATCTAGGYTYHSCSNCGDSYTSNQTAALGHSYNAEQVDNNMVYTCAFCGHSYSESLAVNYTYDKVSVFTADENYVITLYSNRKYYAVTHANNTLSVKQVTVSRNQITSEITEDMLWTYNSGKLSYTSGNNTYYLYAGSSNSGWGGWFGNWGGNSTTLSLSTTKSSTVSFSRNSLKVGSNYLRYSSGKVSLNRSATTTYLFKQNEE